MPNIQGAITILLCLAIIAGVWATVRYIHPELSGWKRRVLLAIAGAATGTLLGVIYFTFR